MVYYFPFIFVLGVPAEEHFLNSDIHLRRQAVRSARHFASILHANFSVVRHLRRFALYSSAAPRVVVRHSSFVIRHSSFVIYQNHIFQIINRIRFLNFFIQSPS